MLKLMYITKIPEVAKIAEDAGADRIMVDLEYIGKASRQRGRNTPVNHHTFEDIRKIRDVVNRAELVVRCNPIHDALSDYPGSKEEIERIIELGADIVMLPYFKKAEEVERYIDYVHGRAGIYPLVETPEAVCDIDEILSLSGIDELHIGLNDLSIGYGKKFLFEVLADGTIERVSRKIIEKGVPYGFGGIGMPGGNMLPAENIIREHYRLCSDRAILSRAFCNTDLITNIDDIREIFFEGIRLIREVEQGCIEGKVDYDANAEEVKRIVAQIVL